MFSSSSLPIKIIRREKDGSIKIINSASFKPISPSVFRGRTCKVVCLPPKNAKKPVPVLPPPLPTERESHSYFRSPTVVLRIRREDLHSPVRDGDCSEEDSSAEPQQHVTVPDIMSTETVITSPEVVRSSMSRSLDHDSKQPPSAPSSRILPLVHYFTSANRIPPSTTPSVVKSPKLLPLDINLSTKDHDDDTIQWKPVSCLFPINRRKRKNDVLTSHETDDDENELIIKSGPINDDFDEEDIDDVQILSAADDPDAILSNNSAAAANRDDMMDLENFIYLNNPNKIDEPCFTLEELEIFANIFRERRIQLGFTQHEVGTAMGRMYGMDFSQTTVSRFEALNLSFKNMCFLKPLMEKWMNDTSRCVELREFGVELPTVELQVKRRKKRTNITEEMRVQLETAYEINKNPETSTVLKLAQNIELPEEIVRVWFSNRRQKERRLRSTDGSYDESSLQLENPSGSTSNSNSSSSFLSFSESSLLCRKE